MKQRFILLLFTFLAISSAFSAVRRGRSSTDYVPEPLVWNSQSDNSSASMPCGGCDVGMNVWVENGDVLFYKEIGNLQKNTV